MSAYCKQCATEFEFNTDDLAHLNPEVPLKEGFFYNALCEGCGWIQVDEQGACVTSNCDRKGHSGGPHDEKQGE